MRIINDRFEILTQLNENSNFVVYEIKDYLYPDKKLILKMTSSEERFQKDLLRKEYSAGVLCRHPLLRPIRTFHKLRTVDGRFVDSNRIFFIADKYPSLYQVNKKNDPVLINAFYVFFSFLHKNGFYHGDLRTSNILDDGTGAPIFFDMSPLYVNTESGRENDNKAIGKILSGMGFQAEEVEVEKLFSHRKIGPLLSDEYIQKITLQHINRTPFPAERLLNLRPESVESEMAVQLVYDYRGVENARIWYEGLLSLIPLDGYELYQCPDEGRLNRRLLNLFPGCKKADEFHRAIEDAAAYGPVAIGIGYTGGFSDEEWKLLRTFSRHFENSRVCFFGYQREPAAEFHNRLFAPLSPDEISHIFTYYFPLSEETEALSSLLWEQTEGEPSALLYLFRQLSSKECLDFSQGITFVRKEKRCFDISISLSSLPRAEAASVHNLIFLIRSMGEKLPLSFYGLFSENEKESMDFLVKEGAVYKNDSFFVLRMPRVPRTLRKKKADIRAGKLYFKELEKLAFQKAEYLESYVALSLNIGYGEEAFEKVLSCYKDQSEYERSRNRPLYFDLFSAFEKKSGCLAENHLFELYYYLLRLDTNHIFDNNVLLNHLKKAAKSEKEHLIHKAMSLTLDEKTGIDDVRELMPRLEKLYETDRILWIVILRHALLKLKFLGRYEEMEEIVEKYKKKIEQLDHESRVMVYNEMFSCYMDKMNMEKLQETAAAMLRILEKQKGKLGLDSEFSCYNNQAIVLRRLGRHQEALDYYRKALDVARMLQNYRYEAIVATNIGVIHYYAGDFEACMISWDNAIQAAEQAKIYFSMVTNSINLSLIYKLLHKYERALKTFEKIQQNLEEAPTVRENSKLHLLYADMLLELGDYDEADKHLHGAAQFYEERGSLKVSYEYFNVKVGLTYQSQGKEAMDRYINELLALFSSPEDISYYGYLFLTAALQECCAYQFDGALDYLGRINKEAWDMLDENDRQSIEIIRFLSGDYRKFPREDISVFSGYSRSMFRLHALIKKERKGSARYLEYCAELLSILDNWLAHIPPQYKESFKKRNPEWRFHETFLKEMGYETDTFNINAFREKHNKMIQRFLREMKGKALKDYRLSPMSEGENLYRAILKDLLMITGMTRGAYFKYDVYEGWQEKVALNRGTGYHPSFPMRKELMNEVLFESSHRDIFFKTFISEEDGHPGAVMIIPVLDIEKLGHNKFRGDNKRQSSFHYFALRGCIYLDCDNLLLIPGQDVIDCLGPLRDYINAAGYYDYLKQTALMDKLTGLYKREHWVNLTKKLMEYAVNNEQQVIIAILDIDHFKNINDRYGHARGDAVLKEVARIIKDTVRATDIAGRYGGEEIAIAMMVPPKTSSSTIIDRIRINIQSSALHKKYNLTASIGYALYPKDGELLDVLIGLADEALYFAKESGRNITIAFETMPSHISSEAKKMQKVIDDPVREREKLDALLALEETINSFEDTERIINEVYGILVELFNAEDLSILSGSRSRYTLYEKRRDTHEIIKREIPDEKEVKGSKINVYRIHNQYSVSVFLSIESERYSLEKDARYFTLIGNIISEKVFLSSFHRHKEVNKPMTEKEDS